MKTKGQVIAITYYLPRIRKKRDQLSMVFCVLLASISFSFGDSPDVDANHSSDPSDTTT
jgi:hypothetical protein